MQAQTGLIIYTQVSEEVLKSLTGATQQERDTSVHGEAMRLLQICKYPANPDKANRL